MKAYTRHLSVLILFLVFTIRCSESSESKEYLDHNELNNLLLSRSDFKPFISTQLQNLIALNSMQPEDEKKIIDFYDDVQDGLHEASSEIKAIIEKMNLDVSTFGYIKSLEKELDGKYDYSKTDLADILLENFTMAYNQLAVNSRVQMVPILLLMAIGYCDGQCVPIADSTYNQEKNKTGWNDVYVGCFKYCLSLQ